MGRLTPEALQQQEKPGSNPQTGSGSAVNAGGDDDEPAVTPRPVPLGAADPSWRKRALGRAARFDSPPRGGPVRPQLRRESLSARPRVMAEDEVSTASSKDYGDLPQARREKLGFAGTESRFESPLGFQRSWSAASKTEFLPPKSSFEAVAGGGFTSVFRSRSDRCQWIRDLKGCGADYVPPETPSSFSRATSPGRAPRSGSPPGRLPAARPLAFGSFLAHDSILGCRTDSMANSPESEVTDKRARRFSLLGSYLEVGRMSKASQRRLRSRSPTRTRPAAAPAAAPAPEPEPSESETSAAEDILRPPADAPEHWPAGREEVHDEEDHKAHVVVIKKKPPQKQQKKKEETPEEAQQRHLREQLMKSKAARDDAARTIDGFLSARRDSAEAVEPPPAPPAPPAKTKAKTTPKRRRPRRRAPDPHPADPVPLQKPRAQAEPADEDDAPPSMHTEAMESFLSFVKLLVESSCPQGEAVHFSFDRQALTRALVVGSIDAKRNPPAVEIVPRQPKRAAAAALAGRAVPVLVLKKGSQTVAALSTGAPTADAPRVRSPGPAARAAAVPAPAPAAAAAPAAAPAADGLGAVLSQMAGSPKSLAQAATLLARFTPEMRQRLVDLIYERSQRLRSGEACYADNLLELVYQAQQVGLC